MWDVFVFDRLTQATTRVSTDPQAGWMEPSGGVALDARGQVLAFSSLHPMDGRDLAHDLDLFVRITAVASSPTVNGPIQSPVRR